MEEKLFNELLESAKQALEHAQGKRQLQTTILPVSPKQSAKPKSDEDKQKAESESELLSLPK